MPLASTYLDNALAVPCTVHARYPSPDPDEHGNVVYVDDPYDTRVYITQQSRSEDPLGRSAEQGYLVVLNAAEVFAHPMPAHALRSLSAPRCSLDAFSWLDVQGIGALEVEGDPSFPTSLRAPDVIHHVEVQARRATTQSTTT